ncbi:hypothetical protein [Streptomyces sp. NPDC046862]|uniref:hypothetical protein n=1 Tax=Streptomyces sp. NPDC046862 TaxID=3154603 RepID=UPI0034526300
MNDHNHDNEHLEFLEGQFANPYGTPVQPVKPGLTKRGKVATAIGVTVIACGTLIGYQSYSSSAAENEAKAREFAYKQKVLDLETMREMNRAAEAQKEQQTSDDKAFQTSVGKCIKGKEGLVGKGFGSPSYKDVVDLCRTQYASLNSGTGTDMEAAGSSTSTSGTGGGGGINEGVLIGGGALALVLAVAARRNTRSSQA